MWCRLVRRRLLAARLFGGTVYGACDCRHSMWCRLVRRRLLAARYVVPPIGGTVPGGTVPWRHGSWRHGSWRRGFGPAGTVPPIGGPCWPGGRAELGIPRPGCGVWECGAWECGCLGMRSLGMRMSGNAEPGNADVLECGCPGMRMSGNADVRECGAWGCGCLGACGCPGTRSLGMRSLGMRMSWSMRGPGMRMSGNAELGGNAESGDCPPARSGRRERCRLKWCRPIGRHLPPPEFRRWLAEPPADWPAAGAGGGCSEVPRGTSQGRLGASWSRDARASRCRDARASWCAAVLRDGRCRPAGMVPPGYGAAYWRRGSWRHGVAGRERCRAAWCLQLEARFRAGAVSGRRGSLGTARGRERGHVKKQSVGLDGLGGRRGRYWGRY